MGIKVGGILIALLRFNNLGDFMSKQLFFLFFLSSLIGCSTALSQDDELATQEPIDSTVTLALANAESTQDYRLLMTTTRGINIPGIKPSELKSAIALCGKKYMSQTGDVITSEQERIKRKKIITYMQQYNQQMWQRCQQVKKR